MSNCTEPNCENPTDLYLCNTCVTELDATLGVIPEMIPVLYMIGRKEEQAFTVKGGRASGGFGPATPLDLNALSLAQELAKTLERNAAAYAQDPDAADWKAWITDRCDRAHLMVYGEEEQTVTPDYIKFRMTQVLPMTTRYLVPWFAETMGIHLTDMRIRKWAERGQITRIKEEGKHPAYHPADILRAHHEMSK